MTLAVQSQQQSIYSLTFTGMYHTHTYAHTYIHTYTYICVLSVVYTHGLDSAIWVLTHDLHIVVGVQWLQLGLSRDPKP